jgi:hypothetical protein
MNKIMETMPPLELFVQSWFDCQEVEIQHLPWPAQLPDLNTTEALWSVLETSVRNRFTAPTSLKQLGDVLQEEWYKIPLQALQNLYKSIPRRIAAELKIKGCPTPY